MNFSKVGGMFRNADFCQTFYPGWTCRVYVDALAFGAIEDHLGKDGAELKELPTLKNGKKVSAMIARHLVAADPNVGRFVVRPLSLSLSLSLPLSQ